MIFIMTRVEEIVKYMDVHVHGKGLSVLFHVEIGTKFWY
jgi:hypothetical protein